MRASVFWTSGILVTASVLAAGCGPAGTYDPEQVLTGGGVPGSPAQPTASNQPQPGTQPAPQAPIGAACQTSGNQICLSVKYVSYVDPSTLAPVTAQDQAIANVTAANELWSGCGVAYEIEQFQTVSAAEHGLSFSPSNMIELDQARSAFAVGTELLVISTGTWNRSGTLGNSTANAWTTMPGAGPFGTVLEAPVSTLGAIIAHELGHYLSLVHVADEFDLMNPIVYDDSTVITPTECSSSRAAAAFFWPQMYR